MVASRTPTVALVGNPNTGKTTLFNALAGMNQHVGNYPGVTVETKKGKLRCGDLVLDVIDLPGTYSLAPRSPDEMLAVDVILGNNPNEPRPDVVVAIADASNLERNLYLMTQVLELGVPVIVALNMMDVAQGQGLTIDVDRLSQQLGVPVIPLQANKGKGLDHLKSEIAKGLQQSWQPVGPAFPPAFELDHLKSAITTSLRQSWQPVGPAFPPAFEAEVARLKTWTNGEPPFLLRRLLLDAGGYAEKRLVEKHGTVLADEVKVSRQRLVQAGFTLAGIEPRVRYGWIRQATQNCIVRPAKRPVTWTDRLDKILTHKLWGTLAFLAVMFLVFNAIFVLADYPMRWIDDGRQLLGDWVRGAMAAGPLRSLLTDGLINGIGAVVKFLPQIMILFALIAVLEDCGYMARAAFLMDRLMSRAGLNGKSFIPLLSSLACAVPGIMSARVIENPRDRLTTILVAPLMSCSARLPVYGLLIGAFLPIETYGWWMPGLAFFSLYMIGFILAPLIAFLLKRTLLRGETPPFVLEMPLYKRPSPKLVARRAFDSGWLFLKRAGTFIMASMAIVWALLYFPSGDYSQQIAEREEVRQQNTDKAKIEEIDQEINRLHGQWKGQSILGRVGRWVEPAVEPLGWDWRIGMAVLASFPAREVIVGTMGIVFGEGQGDADDNEFRQSLGKTLNEVHREGQAEHLLFSIPVAFSIMVFFALCSQCVSTLVVIKRETQSWLWPVFTFVYMTALAYVGALLTYQLGSLL